MKKVDNAYSEIKNQMLDTIDAILEHGDEISQLLVKTTHFSKGETKWIEETVDKQSRPPTKKKMRKNRKKEQWLRDKKSSVKKKILKSILDIYRVLGISDEYSDDAFDEMFHSMLIGYILYHMSRRKGIGDATLYAYLMEKGLREFMKNEAEEVMIPSVNVSYKIYEEGLKKVGERLIKDIETQVKEKVDKKMKKDKMKGKKRK